MQQNDQMAPSPYAAMGSDIDRIVQVQKKAFLSHGSPSAQERIHLLKRLRQAILSNREPLMEAIDRDFGHRSKDESFYAEIFSSLQTLHHTAKNVKKWMRPSWRMPGLYFMPALAKVHYQPLGVVGVIVPWNYPLYLMVGPLAYALAAGNRVIIRMSKCTPSLAVLLKNIFREAFDEDQVALFTGDEISGSEFTKKPWDHLLFTGSTDAGKEVMRAAADNLTPVTLELGGKSPAIISREVPMKDAAERIAWGKMLNSGQTCVAPDYVLCPKERIDEFTGSFREAVQKAYPTLKNNPDFTGIENDQQFSHLNALLEDAKAKGATIVEINPANEDFSNIRKMAPKLILNISEEMLIMQKEIFGPLLPVIPYDSLDEAISFVNNRPRPLALYYFDYNRANMDAVIQKSFSGGVALNDTMVHVGQENMPFGGVGMSGMGKYHGREGFITFSNAKGVLIKPRFNSGKIVYPPYGTRIHALIKKLFLRL